MRRPKWMTPESWADFCKHYMNEAGDIPCRECGTTERVTGDHIRPRHDGGKDDLANIQPLCLSCNSRKGARKDSEWGKQQYFDLPLDAGNLRVAQTDFVMQPILQNAEFFAEPWSQFNGKLFTYVQIVGAGKTIGMFTLPFVLNQCVNAAHPASPRVDRMLIVTKDKPLRHQIAEELKHEPAEFGIIGTPPKVLEVLSGDDLTQTGHDHDIAVMCPNMLWAEADHDTESLEPKWMPHIETILRRYPLIIFDEMHYANAQIARFITIARYNLVFGFTASPLTSNGSLIDDIILMGQAYGYREAAINDQSMKEIF